MLDELAVRNLGVIKEATICPTAGLTVITGETGTGKTLLLGALRLLLGADGRPDLVGPFAEEASVEGRFIDGDQELVAIRRLQRGGRSRAYLDGSIASTRTLAATLDGIEMIGQHDQLSLTRSAEVRAMVDANLDGAGRALLERYRKARATWEGLLSDRERLGGDQRALARELDLVTFQAEEIAKAGFVPGDDQELEARANRLRNAGELTARLSEARAGVEEGMEALGRAVGDIRRALRLDPELSELADLAEMASESLSEIGRQLRLAVEQVADDPEQQEQVEARLTLLGDLRRKYGSDLEEVLGFGKSAAERAGELAGLLARAATIDSDLARVAAELEEAAEQLTTARKKAGSKLTKAAVKHLLELGLSDPLLIVEIGEGELGPWGRDDVRLLFASDSRLAPGEVGKVASGGELSRLVLSLRLAGTQGAGASVLVFDEIDSGIGGSTALAMGRKLAALARERQVLCVTHLPQVAAFAETHYVIEREGATAVVRLIDERQRPAELSRMLAGLPDSERGREAAAELLALAARG
ncbi:MAG TPA: AAA family ATPase [Acidimicrobiia bacterium]|nr:AAA family ATPase [Acidimicrobiia bacterium]